MNSARASGKNEEDNTEKPGIPVCIASSHVDGPVLTLASFSHNYNYRSAGIFGHATLVDDEEEKLYAMELITNSVVSDRWRYTRLPPTKAEIQSIGILKVRINSGSTKISAGQATDDKSDLSNEAMLDSTWTGVLPIYPTMGEPQPSSYNRIATMPDYISEFVSDFDSENQVVSLKTAEGEPRAL